MGFPRKVILCHDEKRNFERWLKDCEFHSHKPVPNKIVSWHGTTVEHLGTWLGSGYEYAAIRFNGQKYHEIINPKYLHDA